MILPIGRRLNRTCPVRNEISNGAGYTLIELILLTIIIAIFVGISTPQFRRTFSDLEFKETSFNITRLISFAQEKAIIEGTPYRLVLDLEKRNYYLTKFDSSAVNKYIRLKDRFGRIFSLPPGIKLKSDKKEVIFYPDGHSDKLAITLLGKAKSLKMSLKGRLGYVEIEGPYQ